MKCRRGCRRRPGAGSAADDGFARVIGNSGERRGIVARTDEAEVAGDRTAEFAATGRSERGRGAEADVPDFTAHAGGGVGARQRAEGLRETAQVDDRIQAVELEVADAGRTDGFADGDRVIRAGGEVQGAAVDRDDAGEAGARVQVHHAVAGFHEPDGAAETEAAFEIEGRAAEDVELRGLRRRAADVHVDAESPALDEHGRGVVQREGHGGAVFAVSTEGARQA